MEGRVYKFVDMLSIEVNRTGLMVLSVVGLLHLCSSLVQTFHRFLRLGRLLHHHLSPVRLRLSAIPKVPVRSERIHRRLG